MQPKAATLIIGTRTFRTGMRVHTPVGLGTVVGLDPFSDTEIGVQLDPDEEGPGSLEWITFRFVREADLDEWSMAGRVQAPHRSGELLDIYSNVSVRATSEAEAITAGARKIAQGAGGDPDQARWVGTVPTPYNCSEALRRYAYRQFDWCI